MKIVIIGAGYSGLASALTLINKGHEVTILEANSEAGGLARSIPMCNNKLDYIYRHIFKTDSEAIKWINKYKLILKWYDSRMAYFTNNSIFAFGKPLDLLKFSPLSWLERLKFGFGVLKMKYNKKYLHLENETAENYLIKIFGNKVYEIIWKPLLIAKFAEQYQEISAVWIWGKIALRSRTRDETGMQEQLGYLSGSFSCLTEKMLDEFLSLQGKILYNHKVIEINQNQDKLFCLKLANNNELYFDKVISTLALPEFCQITKILSLQEITNFSQIKFTASSVLILIMKTKLSDYYWLNIGDRNIPFGGIIEHTNLVPSVEYDNKHIIYISQYMFDNNYLYNKQADEVFNEYLPYLQKIYPNFVKENVLQIYLGQDKYSQPVVKTGYQNIKPKYQTSIHGLYHVGMAHIYPEDRGINYALKTGKECAEVLMNEYV